MGYKVSKVKRLAHDMHDVDTLCTFQLGILMAFYAVPVRNVRSRGQTLPAVLCGISLHMSNKCTCHDDRCPMGPMSTTSA